MEYKFVIQEGYDGYDGVEIYLLAYSPNDKAYYGTIENGDILLTEKEIYERPAKPFLRLHSKGNPFMKGILDALAEALNKAGYKVKVDESERITAVALAEERQKTIDYHRKMHSEILNNLLLNHKG